MLFSFYVLWPNTDSVPGYTAQARHHGDSGEMWHLKICLQEIDIALEQGTLDLRHKMWQSMYVPVGDCRSAFSGWFCFQFVRNCWQNRIRKDRVKGGMKELIKHFRGQIVYYLHEFFQMCKFDWPTSSWTTCPHLNSPSLSLHIKTLWHTFDPNPGIVELLHTSHQHGTLNVP